MSEADYARLRRQREEFHALYDADAATRAARLAALERDDAALAQHLREMLRRADAERAEEPAEVAAMTRTGDVIGRYRLLRVIGSGGMGEVYLAERIDEVHKEVALKLVRTDLALMRERARREQDILARLVHPHIAGLIDAGVSEQGWPWFAMDYIDGEHIDAWCDRQRLDLAARARLFAHVCRAVHYAHKNLVLHRDLKPSNILIDADGAPKLLDFGIAKWLDAKEPAAGATRTLALTPAYASPEQLRGEAATTASDVYQLGLVLYELAAGIGARTLRSSADAPTRVDRAFVTLMQRDPGAAERIASARNERARRLRRSLGGDFARIVAKAIADDPQERYDSAQALADDLDRWSRGLPVAAHRGSFAYRALKLVRRNAAAAAAIAVLAFGLVATSVVAVNRALSERAQRVLVEQQQRRSASLLEFLREAFREGDPDRTRGEKLGAVELLDRARGKLDRRDDLDAPTRAALQTQIAGVLLDLGQAELAHDAAQKAVAALAPVRQQYAVDYLLGVVASAQALQELGRYQAAADSIDASLSLAGRTVGGEHRWFPYLLTVRSESFIRLGQLDRAQTDLGTALTEFGEAGDRGSDDYLRVLNNLGGLANQRGNHRDALARYQQLLRIDADRAVAGEIDRMAARANLAYTYSMLGETRAAIAVLEPLVQRYDSLNTPSHNSVARMHETMALCYLADGRYTQAREELEAVAKAASGSEPWSPAAQWGLVLARARLSLYEGRFEEALVLLREEAERVLPSARRTVTQRLRAEQLTAEAQLQRGEIDAAKQSLQQSLRDARALADQLGQHSTLLLGATEDSLGRALLAAGDPAQARTHLAEAARHYGAVQGADKPYALRSEIHRLWAEATETRDATAVERLLAKRAELVAALGEEAKPQVWQTDLLTDELARSLGRPALDAARRARAESGLAQLDPARPRPRFVGLNGF